MSLVGGIAAAAMGLGGLTIGLSVVAGAATDSSAGAATAGLSAASRSCVVDGPVSGLTPDQAANARLVVSVAMADSAENELAARDALMAAWTESRLTDLGPMPGNQGSLGLFQQRASQGWGTPAEEEEPAQATAMFMRRLLTVRGWDTLAPWVAVQAVQRSASADGTNYEANWGLSGQLLAGVLADANAPGGCGQGPDGESSGSASSHGLPDGYQIPAGTPPAHAAAVTFALAQLGRPYVWGAAGPAAYDCSGLTKAAWATAGVNLRHYTVDQMYEGAPVAPAVAAPGDLVLIPGADPPGPGQPGHVGLYLGDGLVESALDPGRGVVVQTWAAFTGGGLDAVIDPAPGR